MTGKLKELFIDPWFPAYRTGRPITVSVIGVRGNKVMSPLAKRYYFRNNKKFEVVLEQLYSDQPL